MLIDMLKGPGVLTVTDHKGFQFVAETLLSSKTVSLTVKALKPALTWPPYE